MNEITTYFMPSENLTILVREIGLRAKTVPKWHEELDKLESFCNLSRDETAWLAGVRYLGAYTRPWA